MSDEIKEEKGSLGGVFKNISKNLKELLGSDEIPEIPEEETGIISVSSEPEKEENHSHKNNKGIMSRKKNRHNNNDRREEKEEFIATNSNYQTIFFDPKSFDECRKIAAYIKNDNMITINLEYLDVKTSQRLMDFLAGAMNIKGSNFVEISKKVYTIVPNSMKVYYEGKTKNNKAILEFGREE